MADSWQKVSAIQNCFVHCGFSVGQPATQLLLEARVMDEDTSCLLQQVDNQKEFMQIDEIIKWFNENE